MCGRHIWDFKVETNVFFIMKEERKNIEQHGNPGRHENDTIFGPANGALSFHHCLQVADSLAKHEHLRFTETREYSAYQN